MSRKRTYTLRQVKDRILASDSDSEFECSDISDGTDDFDDDSLPVAAADSGSTPVISTPVVNTPVPRVTDKTTWEWDIYDDRDDYCTAHTDCTVCVFYCCVCIFLQNNC